MRIPLTQGLVAVVDQQDFVELAKRNWFAKRSEDGYIYAATNVRGTDGKQRVVKMHQLLVEAETVDHINHDTLDNRRLNLRPATHAEQMRNRKLNVNNTSGFKGVTFNRRKAKWSARIGGAGIGGRRFLGWFDSAEVAAQAYDLAAKQLFGDFALTNLDLRRMR